MLYQVVLIDELARIYDPPTRNHKHTLGLIGPHHLTWLDRRAADRGA